MSAAAARLVDEEAPAALRELLVRDHGFVTASPSALAGSPPVVVVCGGGRERQAVWIGALPVGGPLVSDLFVGPEPNHMELLRRSAPPFGLALRSATGAAAPTYTVYLLCRGTTGGTVRCYAAREMCLGARGVGLSPAQLELCALSEKAVQTLSGAASVLWTRGDYGSHTCAEWASEARAGGTGLQALRVALPTADDVVDVGPVGVCAWETLPGLRAAFAALRLPRSSARTGAPDCPPRGRRC